MIHRVVSPHFFLSCIATVFLLFASTKTFAGQTKSPSQLFWEACKEKNTAKLMLAISFSGNYLPFQRMYHDDEKRWWYPLHIVAAYDFAEAIPILLEHGAYVDQVDQWGDTALDIAVSEGNRDSYNALVIACPKQGHALQALSAILIHLASSFQNPDKQ